MVIVVIDGMGGGIGSQIVSRIRHVLDDRVEILALGTNAAATQKMMRAQPDRGATGENAICFCVTRADFVVAPIGVVIPNSMMGEITPSIATAVASSRARKLLLPITQPYFEIIGLKMESLGDQIGDAIEIIQDSMDPGGERV